MIKRIITFSILAILLSSTALSQEKEVTGVIKDQNNQPVPGTNILEVGTTNGTTSDMNGEFSITVEEGATLKFSAVGLQDKKVDVGAKEQMTITLKEEVEKIAEVQKVAYGRKTKREVSGSLEEMDAETLEDGLESNLGASLQGKSSGVQITQSASGRDVRIRIRGVSSLKSSSKPLIVVDGNPTSYDLSDINPNDIKSMNILKDASATVLYGSRAANGVILITTKEGSAKETRYNVSYQHGLKMAPITSDDLPVLNSQEYLDVLEQAYNNADLEGKPDIKYAGYDGFQPYQNTQYTNWPKKVIDNGSYDKLSFSTSGGSKTTTFYISGEYRGDKGYMNKPDYQKFNSRIKIDHNITEQLSLNLNVSGVYNRKKPWTDHEGYEEAQTGALPIYPFKSKSNPDRYWYDYYQAPTFYAENHYTSNGNQRVDVFNDATLRYQPIKGLTLKSQWSYVYRTYNSQNYAKPMAYPAGVSGSYSTGYGQISLLQNESQHVTTNNIATYKRKIGADHKVKMMVGATAEDHTEASHRIQQEGIPNQTYDYADTDTGAFERVTSGGTSYRFLSGISRFNYGFKKRYFLELSARYDGSSRFGEDHRWGFFPGGAISWVFSDEPFLKDWKFLDMGKMRLSYGLLGNANVGNFSYLGTAYNWFSYGGYSGMILGSVPNQTLQWETTKEWNVGLDLAFDGGRYNANINYFHKVSEDLLLDYDFGMFHGFWEGSIDANIGSIKWEGIELTLNSVNIEGKGDGFSWKTDFNLTYMQSEVLQLAEDYFEAGTNRAVVGEPLGTYYLAKWAGVDPETGHELIYEVDPVKDQQNPEGNREKHLTGNVIDLQSINNTSQHRVLITDKSPYPSHYGGITNTFSYKGLELSVLFNFQFGNWLYDEAEKSRSYIGTDETGGEQLLDGWTKDNPTNEPLLIQSESNASGVNTTRYLHNGSYIRLRRVKLGYTLPERYVNRIYMKDIQVYIAGKNLWLWTPFPGIEPENMYGYSANLNPGMRDFTIPQPYMFTVGVDFKF